MMVTLEEVKSKLEQESSISEKDADVVIEIILQNHILFPALRPALQCCAFLKKLILLKSMSAWNINSMGLIMNKYFFEVKNEIQESTKDYPVQGLSELRKTNDEVRNFVYSLMICDSQRQKFVQEKLGEELSSTICAAVDCVRDVIAMLRSFLSPSTLDKIFADMEVNTTPVVKDIMRNFLVFPTRENIKTLLLMVKRHDTTTCTLELPIDKIHSHLFQIVQSDSSSSEQLETVPTSQPSQGTSDTFVSMTSTTDKKAQSYGKSVKKRRSQE